MRLRLRRTALKSKYTIGHLYDVTNGRCVYICDVIEDRVRDLNKNGKFDGNEKKVKGETAIPYGIYRITLRQKSPKYSDFRRYPWARKYNGRLPRLLDVPDFYGILMHPGTTADDSAGCLIVGQNKSVGKVINSRATFEKLMDDFLVPCDLRGEPIWIEIV